MTLPEFLERDAVLFLHDRAIREFGGRHGLRDVGLFDSALFRPVSRCRLAAPSADLFELAACYAFGIASNHPFIDGNKRTAWSSAVLFLGLNGVSVHCPPANVVAQMLSLVERRLTELGFAAWLRAPET